ncbi:MAG: SMI1/KNR4 family protein [Planctomycetaceae bacterium]
MSIFDRLAAEWKLADVRPDDRETEQAFAMFENRFARELPSDMREFYQRFNGLLDMDADLNRVWPLDELDTVPAIVDTYAGTPYYSGIAKRLPDAHEYFAFADHSIWVCVYAVRLTDNVSSSGPVVGISDGKTFHILSNTFLEFWDRYLATPERTLFP